MQKLQEKHGNMSFVVAKKNQVENEQLPAARESLYTINNRAGVIRETLKFLESVHLKPTSPCPVCSSKINPQKLQNELEAWQQEMQSQMKPIEDKITQLETDLATLNGVIQKFGQLQRELEGKRKEVRVAMDAISVALETEISDSADPLVLINQEIAEVGEDLEAIHRAVEQSNQRLDSIDDQLEDVKRIMTVLRCQKEVEDLLKIQDSSEYKQLEAEREELHNFCDQVVTIGEAIEDVLRNSASLKIDSTKTAISDIYRHLVDRSDFPDIKIDPEKYEVMALGNGESEVALRILNKGDINCAALSIFLGLATREDLTHNMGFMVLDDPSQNLDIVHKERLANILNRVLEKKQLVIATSEDDFAAHLNSKLTKQKKVYQLSRWTEERGPEIQAS